MCLVKCATYKEHVPSTKHPSKVHLTLGAWNLNGIYDSEQELKLNNTWVSNQLKCCDIFTIIESHCSDEQINFQNYHNIQLSRPKSANNRYFGGLSIFIHRNIKHHVTVQKMGGTDYIWLKIAKSLCNSEEDIFICFGYIPPTNSMVIQTRKSDILSDLENDIAHLSKQGKIILGGDFNARTANKPDFASQDNDQHIPLFLEYPTDEKPMPRMNQDNTLDDRGKNILDLCISTQLRIVNGRKFGDMLGHFTCHKWNGSSAPDYFIVSREILPHINQFKVGEFDGTISDHCMISTTLNLPTKNERNITTSALNLEPAPKKIKFNPITIGKYCDTIKTDNIKNKLNTIMNRLNDNSHTDIAITKFNSALLEAAGNAGAPNVQ